MVRTQKLLTDTHTHTHTHTQKRRKLYTPMAYFVCRGIIIPNGSGEEVYFVVFAIFINGHLGFLT